MTFDIPMAPALVLRWLVSFFNIDFELNTRSLRVSLIRVDLGPRREEAPEVIEPFIATYTGGKAYPLGLDCKSVRIEDIAGSLSKQCRYAGHTSDLWSVAQHSLEVARRVQMRLAASMRMPEYDPDTARTTILTALLHDASESYLQDIVRPIKPLVHGYKAWEERVEFVIAKRFGLFYPMPDIVKEVDDEIVLDEIANFYPPGSEAWQRYGITTREGRAILIVRHHREVEQLFLDRFVELGGRP